MAGRRGDRSRRRGGGWISALLWVFILCAAGFTVGIALGLFAENPDLVLQHGTGGTEEIPWSADAVAVAQGVDATTVIAEKLVAEAPVRPPAGARAKPVLLRGGYLVQVGAFATANTAEQQVASLREMGFAARVFPSTASGRSSWRVRLGPYTSREEAQDDARRLERAGVSTWVLANDGEPGSP